MAPIVASGAPALRDVLAGSLDAVLGRPNALGLPSRRRVVVLVVDGLGWEALAARAGHARTLTGGDRRRIVTGAPTTTAAALTTLATGVEPGVHGVVAYAALDPAQDLVVNQLHGFDSPGPASDRATLPGGWQRAATQFERATGEGVAALAVGPRHYATSGFTREALRGSTYVGARVIEERLPAAFGALRTAGRGIAYCYVPELDVAAHRDGWGSGEWTALLERVDGAVRDAVADLRSGETLLVTADHGMVDVPASAHVLLDGSGLLGDVRRLAGEPRLLHVHLVPDAEDAQARWAAALGAAADVRTRQQAIDEGWFGASVDSDVAPRIGDLLVASRGNAAFYATEDAPARGMVGQHGAWTPAERFVPLVRFDG
ncbi:alkaline phosphatase family protein [Amnibacterium kyonggiense]|uniref:alkaline phosphatase family protein n=1 Tax=Amnibacterium kyonggiense TaxID=595671 RepID=UPI001FE8AB20|nr:alkaline phosphatase family protein [Amnibacterium kyonggiense]